MLQMFFYDQLSLKYRIRGWISDLWNQFDVIVYGLFVMSLCLRHTLSHNAYWFARAAWSVTLIGFFLRSLQFFLVQKKMGPKVIMIMKMVSDVTFSLTSRQAIHTAFQSNKIALPPDLKSASCVLIRYNSKKYHIYFKLSVGGGLTIP
jgi:hypothetical protein